MRARLVKWGNDLGLPLPASIAEEAGFFVGAVVDIGIESGNLIVKSGSRGQVCLEDLLGGITQDNIHEGYDVGDAVGREFW